MNPSGSEVYPARKTCWLIQSQSAAKRVKVLGSNGSGTKPALPRRRRAVTTTEGFLPGE